MSHFRRYGEVKRNTDGNIPSTESRVQSFHSTRSFHPLKVNKLIYGDPNATDAENTSIFIAVQNFIKSSKRSQETLNNNNYSQ